MTSTQTHYTYAHAHAGASRHTHTHTPVGAADLKCFTVTVLKILWTCRGEKLIGQTWCWFGRTVVHGVWGFGHEGPSFSALVAEWLLLDLEAWRGFGAFFFAPPPFMLMIP